MAVAGAASGAELPLREHIVRTLRLAGPVMASRAGLLVMTSVDTIMCGRVSAEALAHYGIALAPHLAFMLVGIGLMMGVVVMTAQTDGAGRPLECGRIWRLGVLNALVMGGVFGLLLLPGEQILLALRQDPAISAGGGQALVMFAIGMPPILMFTSTTLFLEGIGRSTPGMVVMALANLVNLGLNYVLMFEPWQMGAAGAALATSITRWFMFLALAAYVLAMQDRDRYGVLAPMGGHWGLERKLARLGWPMALSYWLEHGAFFAAATFAGWLGAVALAGYQIVLNVMALIYMLAIGIATATAVRVGNAVGRLDRPGLARAGWVGLGIGVVVMLGLMPVLYHASPWIVTIYTDDRAVAAVAVPGIVIASWILRGCGPGHSHRRAARCRRHLGRARHPGRELLGDLHPALLPAGASPGLGRARPALGPVRGPARGIAAADRPLPGSLAARHPAVLSSRGPWMRRRLAVTLASSALWSHRKRQLQMAIFYAWREHQLDRATGAWLST